MSRRSNTDQEESFQRAVLSIIERAIDLPTDRQREFVRLECDADSDLHSAVLAILNLEREVEQFLNEPAEEAAALHRKASGIPDLPGSSVGPYELIRWLGGGGMGNVYLARQTGDGYSRHVAVKVVKRGMDTDSVLARFRLERHILASLNHDAIARLIDAGSTHDGVGYFVMEYVRGMPITRYADHHNLSVDGRLDLFEKVCSAVHYAHRNLVVHRDIKPSNILVTEEGQVKLLDFGVAKLLNPDLVGLTIPLTSADVQFLTPEYASPEHIRREPISTASDVYSLGVLLYELLTSHRPFKSESRSYPDVIRAICESEPTRPSTVVTSSAITTRPDGTKERISPDEISRLRSLSLPALARTLEGDLDTIILKAIRKAPDDRYASAEQLREDIVRFRNGLPILARPASVTYRLRKFYHRNRLITWTVSIATILLVGLSALWIVTLSHERNLARESQRRSENVKEFMINVLSQGAVSSGTDGAMTAAALKLVRPALEELETTVDNDHATVVSILNTVAPLLVLNGARGAADSVLQRAIRVGEEGGVPELDRLETLFQLGVLYHRMALYDSSAKYLEQVYARRSKLLGHDDARTLETLKWYAWSQDYSKRPELYEETIERYEAKYGANSLVVADLLSDIGQGATLGLLERALRIYRQYGDVPTNAHAASVMASIAVGIDQTDPGRSLELTKESLAILKNTLGDYHQHTLVTAGNLAAMYCDRHQFAKADSMFSEIVSRREELVPGSSRESASLLYYRAIAKRGLGQHIEAESFFRASLALLPHTHPMYPAIALEVGSVLEQTGRLLDARDFLLEQHGLLLNQDQDEALNLNKLEQKIHELQIAIGAQS